MRVGRRLSLLWGAEFYQGKITQVWPETEMEPAMVAIDLQPAHMSQPPLFPVSTFWQMVERGDIQLGR